MASSTASTPLPGGVDISALKIQLYDACEVESAHDTRGVFHQASIFELGIIPKNDVIVLLQVAQKLVDERLFKAVRDDVGLGWVLRSKEDAQKYRSLTQEQEIVYSIVDEAGQEGIWSKTVKMRTNLHDAVFRQALKALESKSFISEMKSVEHPTRKMYIKSSIRPSDRATGGPWFTDGELDEEFINTVMVVLYNYIKGRTFYYASSGHGAKKAKKGGKKVSVEEAKATRAKALGTRTKTEEQTNQKSERSMEIGRYLPMPAGYRGYPGVNEITAMFMRSDITQGVVLTAVEIQQLLDVMCYDGKVEKILSGSEGYSYKALRKSLMNEDEVTSMLTEAPCGRCPVFDLCEEGGPVGPSNCEYFNDWLDF